MPDLTALAKLTAEDCRIRAIYWCKDRDGRIIEHITTAYTGHKGHVQCIAIAAADPQPATNGSAQ